MRARPAPRPGAAAPVAALLLAALAAGGCAHVRPGGGPDAPGERVEALLLSGGGQPKDNAWSHVEHLRRLTDALRDAGLPPERITVMASDGADPAPDLAVAPPDAPHARLYDGSPLGRLLLGTPDLEDSRLDGVTLLPARKAAIEAWFQLRGALLAPGDTLLLYVTDHGRRIPADPEATHIVLWRETLEVRELRALLGRLAPGVRVVLVMSQCYSGAFARTLFDEDGVRPAACGFFSTDGTRPAYGCTRDVPDEGLDGHGIRFVDALRRTDTLAEAHARVIFEDGTPDVPLRTSDLFAAEAVEREARARGVTADRLADAVLGPAWRGDPARAEAARTADALAGTFALPPPRGAVDLAVTRARLSRARADVHVAHQRWQARHRALASQLTADFRAAHPAWRPDRLGPLAASVLGADAAREPEEAQRAALRARLGPAMHAWAAAARADLLGSLEEAADRTREAADLRYRLDVKLAGLERMRHQLLGAVAEALAAEQPAVRAGLDDLARCEAWGLPGADRTRRAPPPAATWTDRTRPRPVDEELTAAEALKQDLPDAADAGPDPDGLAPGSPAPALDGLAYYRGAPPPAGRPRVLFFWATWCKPCKAALPELLAVAAERGWEIVAISRDEPEALDRFFAHWAQPFPARVARDPEGRISEAYQVGALPTFVVLDPAGAVTAWRKGYPRNGSLRL